MSAPNMNEDHKGKVTHQYGIVDTDNNPINKVYLEELDLDKPIGVVDRDDDGNPIIGNVPHDTFTFRIGETRTTNDSNFTMLLQDGYTPTDVFNMLDETKGNVSLHGTHEGIEFTAHHVYTASNVARFACNFMKDVNTTFGVTCILYKTSDNISCIYYNK